MRKGNHSSLVCCESCGSESYKLGDLGIVSCSADAYKFTPALRARRTEAFDVLTLNTRNHVLTHERIAQGSVNTVHVTPSAILRSAVMSGAPSILVIHNHPSGNPEPSPEDRVLTERIAQACGLMGVKLLDHVIVSRSSYYSFSDAGAI